MAATKHSAEAFVLQDPVQDYEESITILGIYGSLAAAKAALPAHRLRSTRDGGQYEYSPWRESQVEHWRGDEVIASWMYSPSKGWRKNQ